MRQENKGSRGEIGEIGDFVAGKQSLGGGKIDGVLVFEIGPGNAVDGPVLADGVGPAITYDQPGKLGQVVPVGDGRAGFYLAVGQEVKRGFAFVPAPRIGPGRGALGDGLDRGLNRGLAAPQNLFLVEKYLGVRRHPVPADDRLDLVTRNDAAVGQFVMRRRAVVVFTGNQPGRVGERDDIRVFSFCRGGDLPSLIEDGGQHGIRRQPASPHVGIIRPGRA